MKYLKLLVPVLALAALLLVAVPAMADQPGTNEDPFGGLPIPGCGYVQNGNQWLMQDYACPGGIPSNKSGDGTSPRKAIYIGGIWQDVGFGGKDPRHSKPNELANCSTVKIPAGTSRWFKADSWVFGPDGNKYSNQFWVDDELDGATKPSGSAVFGAASNYTLGLNNNSPFIGNNFFGDDSNNNPQVPNGMQGFVGVVYDPTALNPNWAVKPPNAYILTLSVSGSNGVRSWWPGVGGGVSLAGAGANAAQAPGGSSAEGYMSFNKNQPNHLLWYEANFGRPGWSFIRVYNQMIWDGTVTVCNTRVSP